MGNTFPFPGEAWMPWKECSVMDERLRFVAWLLDGEAMSEVCRAFGISRKTGYKIFEGSVRIFVYAEPRSIVLSPQRAEGSKRSPNRMANCPIATVHSIGLCQ